MNPALTRMAAAIGAVAFLVALAIGYAGDVTLLVALFRAAVVMIVTTVVVSMFLRFFTNTLIDFLSQRVMEQKKAKLAAETARRGKNT